MKKETLKIQPIGQEKSGDVLSGVNLPAYSFNKSANLSDQERDDLIKYLGDIEEDWGEEGDRLSAEDQDELEKLFDYQNRWISRVLGLNVASRQTSIKFFNAEKWERAREHMGLSDNSVGGTTTDRNMGLQLGLSDFFATVTHERMHALTNYTKFVQRNDESSDNRFDVDFYDRGLSGFSNERTGSFNFFDEVVTEMITIEILDEYRKQSGTDYSKDIDCSYNKGVILFDLLNEEAAKRLGRDPIELRHDLYRGYFTGDRKVLGLYEEAMGRGTLKAIAGMTKVAYEYTDLDGLLVTIDRNDDIPFIKKSDDYINGREVEVLGGVKIKNPKAKSV